MNNYKLLLLEDEPNVAKLFEFAFTREGFECRAAKNGRIALEILDTFIPDIIISDIMMPEMDGYEFRKTILSMPGFSRIPFVFLTAKGTDEDILTGYDLKINEYILKTSSPKIIIAKIYSILNNYENIKTEVITEIQKASNKTGIKMVPSEPPLLDGFKIEQWHQTFENIPGGDFIDYLLLDDSSLFIILGDVMGKKWNAWYFAYAFAGYIRTSVRTLIESNINTSPADILTKLNSIICNDEKINDVFTTISVIKITKDNRNISYSGAGDIPMIYFNASAGKTKFVQSEGILMGVNPVCEYSNHNIEMSAGDFILLVTDGITESVNHNEEMFSLERISEIADSYYQNNNLMYSLKKEINNFTGGQFSDDISAVYITKTD